MAENKNKGKRRSTNFQRTKFYAYVKLGSKQKKMRKYRRATGRHNKTRQKWKSRGFMVQIGYKNQCKGRGLIKEKIPVLIHNVADLNKLDVKKNIAIIAGIGKKRKIEVAKEIEKRKIEVQNLNIKKFLKENEKKKEENTGGSRK